MREEYINTEKLHLSDGDYFATILGYTVTLEGAYYEGFSFTTTIGFRNILPIKCLIRVTNGMATLTTAK